MIYGSKSDGTYVVESEVPHGTSGTIGPAGPLIASDSPSAVRRGAAQSVRSDEPVER
jgi:hypothetical protein